MKPFPQATPQLWEEMRWTPWKPSEIAGESEKLFDEGVTRVPPPPQTAAKRSLEEFKQATGGGTPGCSACKFGAKGRSHTTECKERRFVYRQQQEAIATPVPICLLYTSDAADE